METEIFKYTEDKNRNRMKMSIWTRVKNDPMLRTREERLRYYHALISALDWAHKKVIV